MSHVSHAFHTCLRKKRRSLLLGMTILLTVLLVGCGGSGTSSGSNSGSGSLESNAPAKRSASSTGSSQGQQKNNPSSDGPQYLSKTLKVGLGVKDTRKVADELQTWITATDTRSSSAGIDYEQAGDNLYNVSLSFSVQATLYPQVERYLRDYASQHGGQLLTFNESVQDVSNDYIDTQSRLKNLRGEQTRLLDLLSHAQALGDIVSIQDKLTDVEGQIENIEAHLKVLDSQVTFYTVAITLQPIATVTPPLSASPGWNIGQTFHDAFAASLAFAQGLATFFIWLLAYSFYIVPVAFLIWFIFRWRTRSRSTVSPPSTPVTTSPPAASA